MTSWNVNIWGALVYTLLVGWLLFASTARIVMDVEAGDVVFLPYVGFGMGLLGVAALAFGRERDRD
jgi:hypothetical protein